MKRVIWIVLLLAMIGCRYDVESELYSPCETPEEVLFSLHVEPLIAEKCAFSGCHLDGDVSGADLDTYENIKSKVDDGTFVDRALVQRDMPSSGSLPDCEIELLQSWIDDGALNN